MIEFDLGGKIQTANPNFLAALGYRLDELRGKHHRIFCDADYVQSDAYLAFWSDLQNGAYKTAEFKRFRKDGTAVWLQATYNPVRDDRGRVFKVVKFATDISELKTKSLDDAGKIAAIYLSQAVIEFAPDGTILAANENFLKTVGYGLAEVQRQHHKIFCEDSYVTSPEYHNLWADLAAGKFTHGEFKRIGKGGRAVYIQAAYNPIFDETGKVVKVVKFAVDMTESVEQKLRNDGISREIDGQLVEVLSKVGAAKDMAQDAGQASDSTASIVNSVAAASEELSASVREIAFGMNRARDSVQTIYASAGKATQSAEGLNETAAAMTQVVGLIQNIASQINLLALNATIESARAGDAGKGFAVVATEVKSLANQAASSTRTIADEIAKMQSVTTDVVFAIGTISSALDEVLSSVTQAASAIDQQTSVTSEISGNMQSAVQAVQQIKQVLSHVSSTFIEVADASGVVKTNVERLVG
ncbi:PAS domain-containing methyl-accepting chemotaxis protein [Asticcacaulis sp. YBE204]|uniref:methyl-accepting chemotaxis protein n=1 Tax=Asticcacaulis sp. YBE204 TaxID=1282363 RepID=UPI001F3F7511|nr:PAS domain-containing methyl-accepting chemotaxis protein [Asticcacaulis sp. YBE204]